MRCARRSSGCRARAAASGRRRRISSGRPRSAQTLEVEPGWELAVETALGDYLEAVCVDRLDELAPPLGKLARGRVALVENVHGSGQPRREEPWMASGAGSLPPLAAKVSGPTAVLSQLAGVLTAESLSEALGRRLTLAAGQSVITRGGEWLGRDWLRVSRGVDHHLGVIEREHRLKGLRAAVQAAEEQARHAEDRLAAVRESLARAEAERDAAQAGIEAAHRRHAEITGQLEAARARARETALRRQRIEAEAAEHAREIAATEEGLARAGETLERGLAVGSDL